MSTRRERRTIPSMKRASAAARDCPLAPPGHATVYSRALHRACLIVGGLEPLAKRLEVPEPQLRAWIQGEEQPPERVFLAAVETILLDAAGHGRPN